jgi:beta-galactosidase
VTVIGASTEDGQFEREVLREVYRRAGVSIEDLPVGLFLDWRAGVLIASNYHPDPVQPPLPAGWRVDSGVWPPPPAGVALLRPVSTLPEKQP